MFFSVLAVRSRELGVLALPGLRCRSSPRSGGVVCMEGAQVGFPPAPRDRRESESRENAYSLYYTTWRYLELETAVSKRQGCSDTTCFGQSRHVLILILIAPLIFCCVPRIITRTPSKADAENTSEHFGARTWRAARRGAKRARSRNG